MDAIMSQGGLRHIIDEDAVLVVHEALAAPDQKRDGGFVEAS